ncbi:oligosaccharyl transferase STT3 subunit [Haloplanus aerogenes]|uniref:Oligosaccharyl transferase STT3 subunit n=1 Tax=Haloplanus aerogenes TaxID=660522 RepID=A0A3M0DVG1_9EURY|nr:STT3 domain-containing protein [Haloplanus aerogenes]RMB23586.1 oligosaccharyl transferase STT3 subunit [Haloplanus aerogenes]
MSEAKWSDEPADRADRQRRIPVRTALLLALALVVLVRLPTIQEVFRDDWIVLASNDPYLYRYLVDQALLNGPLPSLPDRAVQGEPLLVAALSVAAWPFGAGTWGSGFVVAWYPVVAAVLTAAFVYGAAARLTGDVRVGLAAAGLLAVTPAHAYRTAPGVADHHAFDYVWLALTALAVIELLARSERDRRTWLASGALAVAVAAQALAWEAAPLLLVPLAPALGLVALVEIRRPGPERLAPVVADTSALVSLAVPRADAAVNTDVPALFQYLLTSCDVFLPPEVVAELRDITQYQDIHAAVASNVLEPAATTRSTIPASATTPQTPGRRSASMTVKPTGSSSRTRSMLTAF